MIRVIRVTQSNLIWEGGLSSLLIRLNMSAIRAVPCATGNKTTGYIPHYSVNSIRRWTSPYKLNNRLVLARWAEDFGKCVLNQDNHDL